MNRGKIVDVLLPGGAVRSLTPYEHAVNRLVPIAAKMADGLFPDNDEESRNRWDLSYHDAMDMLTEQAGLRKSARKRTFFTGD